MDMYRKFRGADPDKLPMLKARGLWHNPEEEAVVEAEIVEDVETEDGEEFEAVEPGQALRPSIKK
jgi:hypothetical protein